MSPRPTHPSTERPAAPGSNPRGATPGSTRTAPRIHDAPSPPSPPIYSAACHSRRLSRPSSHSLASTRRICLPVSAYVSSFPPPPPPYSVSPLRPTPNSRCEQATDHGFACAGGGQGAVLRDRCCATCTHVGEHGSTHRREHIVWTARPPYRLIQRSAGSCLSTPSRSSVRIVAGRHAYRCSLAGRTVRDHSAWDIRTRYHHSTNCSVGATTPEMSVVLVLLARMDVNLGSRLRSTGGTPATCGRSRDESIMHAAGASRRAAVAVDASILPLSGNMSA
ncbi:hypothetical protein DFH09DRAFT_1301283 [Mycena vulgaris]|nr:hypothetical protein DFH09DRAFT_1301283 [Mycena vulgaris]